MDAKITSQVNTRGQLNALINSLNDIIYEFDENKVCLNVWFNEHTDRIVDPGQCLGKKIEQVLGDEKALKFNNALDYVIQHKKPTSLEFISDYGTGSWFIAKLTPVFDKEGNYLHRISASVSDISEQKKYEQELCEKELLLLEAQNVAKIGNWLYDNGSEDIILSDNLLAILEADNLPTGIEKFEYYLNLVHPDDRDECREYLMTSYISNEKQFEHRIITPSGKLKYVRIIIGDTVFNEDGSFKRIFGILQDISDIKLSQKAIKKGQTQLVEAQTIAKIGNWSWRPASGRLSSSDEIANIFEVNAAQLSQLNPLKLLLKYTHKSDRTIIRHLFKGGALIPGFSCVLRIVTAAGKIKYISIIITKVLLDEKDELRKLIGTLQDVTEQKQFEIDYKRTENKYKTVLETIKLIALSLDNDANIIFCNQYLANLLGYSQAELLGLNWMENFIPADIRQHIAGIFAGNNIPMQYTNPIVCRDGSQRIISWQNTITYDENGKVKETTSLGEDITDQQKATQELISAKEMAERSSKFKSEFLSTMSHEIRTPMNAVIGTTNLLLSADPKPDQLEYLNILKFSGENLLAIINDILDYNKIEAGKLELNLLKFDLHQLAKNTIQVFNGRAAEKKLDLVLQMDDALPRYLIGDPMRLSQILNNLIGNAIKFTKKGKITLQLQALELNFAEAAIKFTVTDTGIGISPENQAAIFDPFVQDAVINQPNNAGSGLGLAITKRLVNLYKSDISVVSEPGKGSQFWFVITFPLPAQADETALKQPETTTAHNMPGMKVLLVDDNKMNLLIASRFLKRWQVESDEAMNGQEAVAMAAKKNYDLIIMDLQMPVMNGFEATEAIRTTNTAVPIIALTADAMPETYDKALQAGMNDYLTKPFVPEVFFNKVLAYYKTKD